MEEADLRTRRGCAADLGTYWRGLRLFWDPRGRSSRTQVYLLVIVPAVMLIGLEVLFAWLLPVIAVEVLEGALFLLAVVPIPAAAARRFHDMAMSGWFALPLLPACALAIWDRWLDYQAGPYAGHDMLGGNSVAELFLAAFTLLYVVLLAQPARDENNPYGPNPRPAPKTI